MHTQPHTINYTCTQAVVGKHTHTTHKQPHAQAVVGAHVHTQSHTHMPPPPKIINGKLLGSHRPSASGLTQHLPRGPRLVPCSPRPSPKDSLYDVPPLTLKPFYFILFLSQSHYVFLGCFSNPFLLHLTHLQTHLGCPNFLHPRLSPYPVFRTSSNCRHGSFTPYTPVTITGMKECGR